VLNIIISIHTADCAKNSQFNGDCEIVKTVIRVSGKSSLNNQSSLFLFHTCHLVIGTWNLHFNENCQNKKTTTTKTI